MSIHRRLGRRRQIGASLVEVLVAILLSAFALLALAASNAAAIRYTKMSQYRATAVLLASDLAERIRANRLGQASYVFTQDFAAQTAQPDALDTCDQRTETCNAAAMAAFDLAQWRRSVRSLLPRGSMFLRTSATTGTAMDLWVVWQDPSLATDDAVTTTRECPDALSRGTDTSIHCSYFRINL